MAFVRDIGETQDGYITDAWSVVRVHFMHDDKMTAALMAGWEPFGAVSEFVMLRRHSTRPFGSPYPVPETGEYRRG